MTQVSTSVIFLNVVDFTFTSFALVLKCISACGVVVAAMGYSRTILMVQSVLTGLFLRPARRRSDAPRRRRRRYTFHTLASPEQLWPTCAIWVLGHLNDFQETKKNNHQKYLTLFKNQSSLLKIPM